jgi:Skp family chaperone for outer membrane proteins
MFILIRRPKMNRRKRTTILALVLFMTVLAISGFAQQSLKVAVVNSQRAFETSIEGKKAAVTFQERDTKIKADLQKMDDKIRSLETKLNTQRLTLTQEAAINLQSDIDKATTDRKRYEEDASREMQKLQFDLVQKIRNEMVTVIDGIAKEKSYDLILDLAASGIVFFNPVIDITDEVVKRYDASKATAPVKK